MSIQRELTKDSSSLTGAIAAVATVVGVKGLGSFLKSRLPERVAPDPTRPVGSKDNADFVVSKLTPLADVGLRMISRTIGGVEYKYIHSEVPAVIHDVLHDAMNGFSICDYYEADRGVFSLVTTNSCSSLECFWTGNEWKFFLAKQPVTSEEALVVYKDYVRNHLESKGYGNGL